MVGGPISALQQSLVVPLAESSLPTRKTDGREGTSRVGNALEGDKEGFCQERLQKRLLAVGKAVGRRCVAGANRSEGRLGADRSGWQGRAGVERGMTC